MLNDHLIQTEECALLGDPQTLLDQLGSNEGLVALTHSTAAAHQPQVDNLQSLRLYLQNHLDHVLIPSELPVIYQAAQLASRSAARELIALDKGITFGSEMKEIAAASQRVGRSHLRRLRPLRDQRLVQRYLNAVEDGRAHGWHTVVYGMILALYSIPYRQGLINYAWLTLRGFLQSSTCPVHLTEAEQKQLLNDLCARLPAALEATLAQQKAAITLGTGL